MPPGRHPPQRAGRKDRPRRSFTSGDGGKTGEPLEGEYLVRLHLVQYVPQGHFVSPVIDLGARPLRNLVAAAQIFALLRRRPRSSPFR